MCPVICGLKKVPAGFMVKAAEEGSDSSQSHETDWCGFVPSCVKGEILIFVLSS